MKVFYFNHLGGFDNGSDFQLCFAVGAYAVLLLVQTRPNNVCQFPPPTSLIVIVGVPPVELRFEVVAAVVVW